MESIGSFRTIFDRLPGRGGLAVLAFALALGSRALASDGPAAPVANGSDIAALKMAQNVAAQIKGARVVAVQPNGSMRPIFEEKAYLLVEPASYESLRIGDIVLASCGPLPRSDQRATAPRR